MGLTKPRAAQIFNLDYKQSTRVVTTTNVTLSGGAPSLVDGITLSLGDRVLVTGQTTGSQNGLYYITTLGSGANGTWARTSDGNENGEIEAGMIVMVTEGTVYADTQWKLITDDPIVIGTTALTFTQNYSANSISAGTSNVVVNTNAAVTISSAGTANVVLVGAAAVTFTGNVNPSANVTYTLGNTTNRWKDIWLSNSSIYLGNIVLAATATALTVNGSNVVIATANNDIQTTGNVSATGNVTASYFLGNVACASGIFSSRIFNGTSEANIGASGGNANISIGGTSNVLVVATTGTFVTGLASVTGNVQSGNLRTAGLVSATGSITGASVVGGIITGTSTSVTGTQTAASTVGGVITGSSVSVTGTATAASTVGGVITGSSSSVTGTQTAASTVGGVITGSSASVTGAVSGASASVSGGVTAASVAGGVITGTSTSVTGTQTASSTVGGVITGSSTSVTGTATAASTVGGVITGSSTSVTGSQTAASTVGGVITGSSVSVTGTATAASTVGGVITGSSASLSGNVSGGNLNVTGNIVDTGALSIITGSNGNINLAPNGTGIVTASGNISTAGNIITGNILTNGYYYANGVVFGGGGGGTPGGANTQIQFNDNGAFNGTAGLTFNKTTNAVATTGTFSATGNVSGGNLIVTGNIVDTGALSIITGSNGNIALAPNGTGNINTGANIMPTANATSNIGSATLSYNTIFARATSAQYADLAEMYQADADYAPGTVVEFGGTAEVTQSTASHSTRVAGIVSTNPSYLMNATLTGDHAVPVALVGRVPCQVVGTIAKGDRLVASTIPGAATTLDPTQYQPACIIGKALEDYDSTEVGVIEVAVGRT